MCNAVGYAVVFGLVVGWSWADVCNCQPWLHTLCVTPVHCVTANRHRCSNNLARMSLAWLSILLITSCNQPVGTANPNKYCSCTLFIHLYSAVFPVCKFLPCYRYHSQRPHYHCLWQDSTVLSRTQEVNYSMFPCLRACIQQNCIVVLLYTVYSATPIQVFHLLWELWLSNPPHADSSSPSWQSR